MTELNLDFNQIEDKDCGPITCHVTTNLQIAIIKDESGIVAINRTEGAVIRDWLTHALNDSDCSELATDVASILLCHIDQMYPDMWKNVPRTARISIRNTIIREINSRFHSR